MKRSIVKEFVQWFCNDFYETVIETIEQALSLLWKIIKAILFITLAVGTIELWILPFVYRYFCCRNDGEE